jgi:hypothetical protein
MVYDDPINPDSQPDSNNKLIGLTRLLPKTIPNDDA